MPPALNIASVNTDATLSIEVTGVEQAVVAFESMFAKGIVQLWLSEGTDSLVEFFRSMAADWHGWLGSKTWSSLEGDCVFDATADRAGHITITVTLDQERGQGDQWFLKASLEVEAGQLDAIAKRAATLLKTE